MQPPEQTIGEVLQGFDLTLEKLQAACNPTLPNHRLIFQSTIVPYGDFFANVLYRTSDPEARQAEVEGWVGGFFVEIEHLDYTTPPSQTNREVRLDVFSTCDEQPHPDLFNPIVEKIKALIKTGNLQIFISAPDEARRF